MPNRPNSVPKEGDKMTLASGITCRHCSLPDQFGLFCARCDVYMPDTTGTVRKVTYTRRFFASVLEGIAFVGTLVIGWYIWLLFSARYAQSPAKGTLHIFILNIDTGQPISAGRVWMREVLVKQLLVTAANFVTGIAWFVDDIWVLFDRNRQALHDKVVNTVVVYAPDGLPELRAPAWAASSPEDEEQLFQRGCELANEGRWEEAIAQFDKTITMNPHHGNAYAQRGFVYAELGEANEAIADMEDALSLTDEPELIADLEAAIKKLRERSD